MKLTCPACGEKPSPQTWELKDETFSSHYACPTHGCQFGTAPMACAKTRYAAQKKARENWNEKAERWLAQRKGKKPGC